MENASNSAGGIGFTGALTLLFIGLKLTGYIGWSWWWVLSPLWIIAAIVAGVFVGVILGIMAGYLIFFIVEKFEHIGRRKS